MNLITTTLFEDPFVIYVLAGLAAVALVVFWRTQSRAGGWLGVRLLIVAAVAGGAFGLERLVVTDREQIYAALRDIAESVPAGRIDHAVTYLDDSYRGWGAAKRNPRIRALLAKVINEAVARFKVEHIALMGEPKLEFSDDLADGAKLAKCTVTMVITYTYGGKQAKYPMTWKLDWIKRREGWRIEGAEPKRQVQM